MDHARATDQKVVGACLILLGLVALGEGWRLHALRTQMVAGAVVGDDTFPMIVGVSMVGLGAAAWLVPLPSVGVTPAEASARVRMLASAAGLGAYWVILPYVGYTAGTVLTSVGLFRAMGGYRWPTALLLGAVTTTLLHLLFRVWLRQPLPTGWLGG